MTRSKPRLPFYAQLLLAMACGCLAGVLLGPKTSSLGILGKIVIQLIKTLAIPLLFFAIIDAFLRTEVKLKSFLWILGISAINAFFALIIGLTTANALKPGTTMGALLKMSHDPQFTTTTAFSASPEKIDFLKGLSDIIPSHILQPFTENAVLGVILLALLLGAALRHVKHESQTQSQKFENFEQTIQFLLRAHEIIISWVIKLVPLAVFGVVAKAVASTGFAVFKGLALYVGVGALGLFLHVFFIYQAWLVFVVHMPLIKFWRGAWDAILHALGVSSSLATLPLTLRCLHNMNVSSQSARISACIGTNFNNDGILLYEAFAAIFVAQMYGIHLSLSQQVILSASCLMASIGIAGVPEAGLISLSLVLTSLGLPLEVLPLLLTVDWILSRLRAATNVTSDMVGALVLDRIAHKKKL